MEIALAAVLLMGGGAMVRSFNDLLNSDRGYVPAGVATMSVSVPYDEARYEAAPARLDAYDQVLASIAKVPGVIAVGAVTEFPGNALGILGSGAVTVPGRTILLSSRRCTAPRPTTSARSASPSRAATRSRRPIRRAVRTWW